MPRAAAGYNLQIVNPNLAKEWHLGKNSGLSPREVSPRSNKKVWWICKKGHEWEAAIANRAAGTGCPYCAGKAVCKDNCLKTLYPSLAKEWHPTKNRKLTPKDVTAGSTKKAWWICKRGHEWESRISHRANGVGCPYCAGQAVSKDNSLGTLYPSLSKEWHPKKNMGLTPRDFRPGSHKKAWWICKEGHEWQAQIKSRVIGRGCPFCKSKTSQIELRIYTEMKYLFGNVEHRKRVSGRECDIYIPNLRVGIEVDSLYWHKDRYSHDREKSDFFDKKNISLIRVREKGLKKISRNDIIFSEKTDKFELMKNLATRISSQKQISKSIEKRITRYLDKGKLANHDGYRELLDMLPSPLPGFSLWELDRSLSKEWHPTKNGNLKPKDVTPYSHKKVWWACRKGHEWKALISNRSKGRGCPYCSGKAVCDDNCLENVNPGLAKEWHPTKNGRLTPKDVTLNSHKRVWWICKQGHEWETPVANRSRGSSCPYCSRKEVCDDNCLQTLNPRLAAEWHPTKNKKLTPKNVTAKSDKRVWWICSKGHEWKTTVNHRSNGTGCPYCAGKAVSTDNSLQTINPTLAQQWHPTKNGDLTPSDVRPMSHRKVWWSCSKGHEWEAYLAHRSRGSGCPYCAGRLAWKENCLQNADPGLSKQWHLKRNGRLTPKDVTPYSHKKVWWRCNKEHEWEATVASRNMGRGCPYCAGRKKKRF